MKNSKKTQRNWIIASIVVISVLIASFIIYSIKTDDVDSDTPPTLSLEGTAYKGLMTDLGGYMQYESGDTCEHDVSLGSHILKAGTGLYYATENLSIQDVVDRINCVPFNKILIAYWDPVGKIMYTYPEGPYIETELITDLNFTIPALHSFTIISKKETLIGGINNENEAVQYDLSQSTDNIFDAGSLYGFVNDVTSGWILIPGISNGGYLIEYLNESDLVDRVEKIYSQTGEYDFAPVVKNNGVFDGISFNEGYYMVWMKLLEEPEAPEDCGGEDSTHICMTDGSNPAVFLQTGDEACENCVGIEASCHNINGGAPDWISTGESCSDQGQDFQHAGIVDTTNCAFRAECGFVMLVEPMPIEYIPVAPEEPEPENEPENECGGADASHVCVTGAMDIQTSHGMMSENIFYTGEQACQTINKTCVTIETSSDENGPWTSLVANDFTPCTDRLPDAVYDGTIQGYIINESAHYPYLIRAVCQ